MVDILRAASGQQVETNSNSGPGSYPTGGFSIRSDLGRVDEATVQVDDAQWEARVNQINDNNAIEVQVFSQASGTEAAAGTDLSGDSFTTSAQRL